MKEMGKETKNERRMSKTKNVKTQSQIESLQSRINIMKTDRQKLRDYMETD